MPSLLLAGPSGTGKIVSASVIARELGPALYRVDLSHVVSEHAGETGKNLAHLFERAEDTATCGGRRHERPGPHREHLEPR